jgi:hypothetical protein
MEMFDYWGCPPAGPLGGRRLDGILWNISRSWSTAASRFSSPSMTLRERSSSSSVIWNALRCSITLRPFSTSFSTGSASGNLAAPPLGVALLERGGGSAGVGRCSGLRPGIIMTEGGRLTYGTLTQLGLISRVAGLPRGGLSGTWEVVGCRPVMIDSGSVGAQEYEWIIDECHIAMGSVYLLSEHVDIFPVRLVSTFHRVFSVYLTLTVYST